MTRIDQKFFCTALAFLAVAMKSKDASSQESAEQILRLSGLMEAFCTENVIKAQGNLPADEASIDQIIERRITELRDDETTRLPVDKETLIKLYDRLHQRKARRMQREFYANVTEAKLADLILHYLDEEIEDDGRRSLS